VPAGGGGRELEGLKEGCDDLVPGKELSAIFPSSFDSKDSVFKIVDI